MFCTGELRLGGRVHAYICILLRRPKCPSGFSDVGNMVSEDYRARISLLIY